MPDEKSLNSAPQSIEIKPAKGRPMLSWVGKRPLRNIAAYPAQLIETYSVMDGYSLDTVDWLEWPKESPKSGLLFHGDNKDVLAHLLAHGFRDKVQAIYIDPPFDSAADYVREVVLKGSKSSVTLEGEPYSIGEQLQYTDIWVNDNYLQFMYERLLLLKELLSDKGSIFLHCDWRMVHRLRLIMDEVFGEGNFINEVAWKHTVLGGTHGRRLPKSHETILWYGKTQEYFFNSKAKSARIEFGNYIKKTLRQDEDGRWFYTRGRMGRQPSQEELVNKAFTKTYVEDPSAGTLAGDIWDDLMAYRVYGDENVAYPTQKNEALVSRCVELASKPSDLILDCFIGSGTTAAVAQKLGRRWIAADINKGAIQTTSKRLQGIMQVQIATLQNVGKQLPGLEVENPFLPCQLSFSVYRLNDYDLQIQHNEAFNLAVEHLGMTRTKTDPFFDGTLGKRLVKIISFNHPLTPLDLEEIKNELTNRPEEGRDIVVVCLGQEIAVDAWLEEWNRLRRQGDFPNKIEVIELKSDPKYGGFFIHEPAKAKVRFDRTPEGVVIEIEEFISPTILKRLEQQSGPLLKPQITDWRSMVDSVMIDSNYDGQVFNITLADVPEKKSDLVDGKYTVQVPQGGTVAVKITDMLGEEVLVTKNV